MGTVTIINTTPYKFQPVPEVGKEYKAFDDGKIRPSRLEVVKILEVIPFKECQDNELISNWTVEVADCYWLYAQETDYFVKAEYDDETAYFVRTKDGGWFSLGWFGSRLDIDGSLYEKMKEWYDVEE
jgi:hypothetical protein